MAMPLLGAFLCSPKGMAMPTDKIIGGTKISDADPLAVQLDAASRAALENITVDALTVADGADVTQGALADAAVAAGAAGSISAKLRRATTQLAAIAAQLPAALGQSTAAQSLPVVLASDQSAVPVKGNTFDIRVVPTVTAGAYSANDVVGGVLTFANAARNSGDGGVIESIVISDRGNVGAALTIVFFSATPSSAIADNGAFTWGTSDADLALFVGSVDIATSDYKTLATGKKTATKSGVGIGYACAATSLFAYIIGTAGPTYVATTDLGCLISVLRD